MASWETDRRWPIYFSSVKPDFLPLFFFLGGGGLTIGQHPQPSSDYRGVDFFPAAGSPGLHNSREHTSPNFLSISVNTDPSSVVAQ